MPRGETPLSPTFVFLLILSLFESSSRIDIIEVARVDFLPFLEKEALSPTRFPSLLAFTSLSHSFLDR